MRSLKFVCAAVAALLILGQADACSRRRTTTRTDTGTVVISPRNPLMVPPTPAPTPPPPPPPQPGGWVPPPPRPPVNQMGRSNCDVDIQFVAPPSTGTISRVDITEKWVYTCTFNVYVEVEVSNISQPTPCACAMAWTPVRTAANDSNFQRSQKTEIFNPLMIVYDVRSNVVVEPFPAGQFDNFLRNANTTAAIREQAGTTNMDYSSIVEGFSAMIQSTNPFPDSLTPGKAKYTPNNVPALCFQVKESYASDYKWPEPPFPLMYTTPNVWISACVAIRQSEENGRATTGVAKRDILAGGVDVNTKFPRFMRDYYLFPVTEASSGSNVPARYLTSYHNDSNCEKGTGLVTLDREFTFTIARERTFNLYGAFEWRRFFGDAFLVGGVPAEFSDTVEFWSDLHTKITWTEPISKPNGASHGAPRIDANGDYALYIFLLGQTGKATATDEFALFGAKNQMCSTLPAGWKDCSSNCIKNDSQHDSTKSFRKEGALKFKIPATGFDCRPYFYICSEDKTLLSFQNFGDLARDFSKRRDSFLLTGPRAEFCNPQGSSLSPMFDALYLVPYRAGIIHRKRQGSSSNANGDFLTNSQNGDGLITGKSLHNGQVDANNVPVGQVTAGFAAGQADANGRPGGDHPLKLFSELYSLPISLHPDDTSFDGQYGTIWNGQPPPCLEGSQGCSCRELSARAPCDGVLTCNEKRFCERPTCPAGEPGCLCAAGNTCKRNNYACSAQGVCVFQVGCQSGEAGCPCIGSTGACGNNATCIPCDTVDNDDPETSLEEARKAQGSCFSTCAFNDAAQAGKTGYPCNSEGKCNSASDVCDAYLNVCKPPTCSPGQGGCLCALGGRCASNFDCDKSSANSNDYRCVVRRCPAGAAGCPCKSDKTCDGTYACQAVDNANSDFRCVLKARTCTNDHSRCTKYCGNRGVQSCPACSDQLIRCFEASGAATVVPSIMFLVAIVLALLF